MLEANIAAQLKTYLGEVTRAIEIVASLDESDKSREMKDLLEEIAAVFVQIGLLPNTDWLKGTVSLPQPNLIS
jgi:NADH-dependent peroxiredoxin subunit F